MFFSPPFFSARYRLTLPDPKEKKYTTPRRTVVEASPAHYVFKDRPESAFSQIRWKFCSAVACWICCFKWSDPIDHKCSYRSPTRPEDPSDIVFQAIRLAGVNWGETRTYAIFNYYCDRGQQSRTIQV